MAVPAQGTIPALPQYQPGALPVSGQEVVEIASSTNATTAASFQMLITDLVGKAPSVMSASQPVFGDLLAFFQSSTNLPKQCSVSTLAQAIGLASGNLPAGGGPGQIVAKNSVTNYDASWYNLATFLSASTSISLSGSTTVAVSVTPNSIGANQIATGGIVATSIATGAITGAQIAANTIGSSQIQTGGVYPFNIFAGQRSITTSSFSALVTDRFLNINVGTAATCTLPAYTAFVGALTFKDVSGTASVNNITINALGTQTIDGTTTFVITNNYQSLTIRAFADGVNTGWFIT